MDYKAVPFDPPSSRDNPAASAASELESIIDRHSADGWEFAGVQNHGTVVPGSSGCFGMGATNPYQKTVSVIVFRK